MKDNTTEFFQEMHVRNLFTDGDWSPMLDDSGHVLEGIFGKSGVVGSILGHDMGIDAIKMLPGSSFPFHIHVDTIHGLIGIFGEADVCIGSSYHRLKPGVVMITPANVVHGVTTIDGNNALVVFFAVGYPNKHVLSQDRMQVVDSKLQMQLTLEDK